MQTNNTINTSQVVSDWAQYTVQRLQKSLLKKKVGQTGILNNSMIYAIKSMGGQPTSVQIEFSYYGKFVDMGVGRGQKIESVASNRDIVSLLGVGRRPKKWFSKTMYGEIAALRKLLGQEYGQIGAQILRDTISNT